MIKDPICGMDIDKEVAKESVEHMGQTFYFCSSVCKEKFEKEPMKYMGKQE